MYRGAVPASQALADRLIAAGYAGMQVRSFASGAGPNNVNLVFWRWRDRLPSRVVVIDDQAGCRKREAAIEGSATPVLPGRRRASLA